MSYVFQFIVIWIQAIYILNLVYFVTIWHSAWFNRCHFSTNYFFLQCSCNVRIDFNTYLHKIIFLLPICLLEDITLILPAVLILTSSQIFISTCVYSKARNLILQLVLACILNYKLVMSALLQPIIKYLYNRQLYFI